MDVSKGMSRNVKSGIYIIKNLPEARKKISDARKGSAGYWLGKKRPPFSKVWRKNISKSSVGRKTSDETKKKISVANKGRASPFKGKQGTRLGIKNKKRKEKHEY